MARQRAVPLSDKHVTNSDESNLSVEDDPPPSPSESETDDDEDEEDDDDEEDNDDDTDDSQHSSSPDLQEDTGIQSSSSDAELSDSDVDRSSSSKKERAPAKFTGAPKAKIRKSRAKKVKEEIPRKTLIQRARATNPHGVLVLEKDPSTSDTVMAGYLGLKKTNELRGLVERKRNKKFLKAFTEDRKKGFGIPGYKVTNQVQVGSVFKLITENHEKSDKRPLFRPTAYPPIAKDVHMDRRKPYWAHATWASLMFWLVRRNTDIFTSTHNIDEDSNVVRYVGCTAEDLNRAFFLIRWFYTSYLKSEPKGKGKGEKKATRNMKAVSVQYMTAAEADAVGPSLRVAQVEQAERESIAEIFSQKDMWNSMDHAFDTRHMTDEERARLQAAREQGFHQIDEKIITTLGTGSGSKNDALKDGPANGARPLLNKQEIERFLLRQRQQVNVKHDQWVTVNASTTEVQSGAIAGALAEASMEEDLPFRLEVTEEAKQAFWEFRQKLSRASQIGPSFDEACVQLNLDPHHPQAFRPDGTAAPLRPNPWQVTGAAWMQDMEKKMGSGIVADDCGVGKTILTLFFLVCQAIALEREAATQPLDPDDLRLRPTLILCPTAVVDVWWAEFHQHFAGLLYFRQFYGSKEHQSSPERRTFTLGTRKARSARKMLEKEFPPGDLRRARLIVVSTYETWSSRSLRSSPLTAELKDLIKVRERTNLDFEASDPGSERLQDGDHLRNPFHRESRDLQRKFDEIYDPLTDEDEDEDEEEEGEVENDGDDEAADSSLFRDAVNDPLPTMTTHRHPTKDLIDDKAQVHANIFKHFFRRVIADEGHRLKHSRTRTHRSVYTLYCPSVWILTATPMLNQVADLLGYLNFFWDPDFTNGDIATIDDREFYSPEFFTKVKEEHPDYVAKFGRVPLYTLDPTRFARIVNRMEMTGELARLALKSILSITQLRRTMATTMVVNGKALRIGDQVPSYDITTVELGMNPYESKLFEASWAQVRHKLTTPNYGANTKRKGKGGRHAMAEAPGRRDMAIHRMASLASFDMRLPTLLERVHGNLAADVATWYQDWFDGGATMYFRTTCQDPSVPVPVDRFSLAEYICRTSPKLRYLCGNLHEALFGSGEQDKTLIFCNWPLEQWEIVTFLRLLGIETISLRTDMTALEKADTIRRFRDPTDQCKVLVCNYRSTAMGVNLQAACHRLVMITTADNISTVLQTIGRIHRLGQRKNQQIWILGVDYTYDQILQGKAVKKMIPQLCGEAELDTSHMSAEYEKAQQDTIGMAREEADQHYRSLRDGNLEEQADRLIQSLLGMRCSRLPWDNKDLHARDLVEDKTPVGQQRPTPTTRRIRQLEKVRKRTASEAEVEAEASPAHKRVREPDSPSPTYPQVRPPTRASSVAAATSPPPLTSTGDESIAATPSVATPEVLDVDLPIADVDKAPNQTDLTSAAVLTPEPRTLSPKTP